MLRDTMQHDTSNGIIEVFNFGKKDSIQIVQVLFV